MFLHLSVILFTFGSLSRGASVRENPLPHHRTVMCGRYASYWNAFLLFLVARRVTLVVAFGLLPHNFGKWQRPINAIFSLYYCSLSCEDSQRW